jgi:CelD/BcsL family acetyltransferase involved in cellulose biosynthesis
MGVPALAPATSLRLERLDFTRVDWDELDALPDRTVFQTREWLAFVAETQRAEPVVAAVKDGGDTIGFFTGLVVRRFGIRILGSPMRGWTTNYLGFNLPAEVPRHEAVAAMLRFAVQGLGCAHVELRARELADAAGGVPGVLTHPKTIFEVDLRPEPDEILARMKDPCRRCIRKAEREGVVVEQADDPGFAADYYAQLQDVFAKQGLVPTYDLVRVEALIRHLLPTGRLLLLRARAADGTCIATGIFPAFNRTMYFWGGASWRAHQTLRPNEALMWHALRHWRERGIEVCDLGGGAEYKRKYGVTEVFVPELRYSRVRALAVARQLAKRTVRMRQVALGRVRESARWQA